MQRIHPRVLGDRCSAHPSPSCCGYLSGLPHFILVMKLSSDAARLGRKGAAMTYLVIAIWVFAVLVVRSAVQDMAGADIET